MAKDLTLDHLLKRVEKLEKAVFGGSKPAVKKGGFSGATGGLRFLVERGFFAQRRLFGDIEEEMKKHGYYYSKQAIQTPLNRLAVSSGPLVALKQGGKKVYVKRK
jgi:hypothetical protein